jgi:hypothetical protein
MNQAIVHVDEVANLYINESKQSDSGLTYMLYLNSMNSRVGHRFHRLNRVIGRRGDSTGLTCDFPRVPMHLQTYYTRSFVISLLCDSLPLGVLLGGQRSLLLVRMQTDGIIIGLQLFRGRPFTLLIIFKS